MNKNKLHCPQCGNSNDNMDADETIVYHCYNCGYPTINRKKQSEERNARIEARLKEK